MRTRTLSATARVRLGLVFPCLSILFCAGGPASAQVPFRGIGSTEQQRALGASAGASALSPGAVPGAPGAGTATSAGFPSALAAGADRFFGTDVRTLGADGRIIGPDGRILYPPPLEQPLDPERYLVDKGDVLQARLWGDQNFDISLPVDPDGRLFVPRVGYVVGHGRTLAQVSAEILKLLQGRFPKLKVAVTLAVPRTFLVRVTGAVGTPGGSVAVNAWTRASEAIQRAGGVLPGGSSRTIELHRADGSTSPVDLLRYPLFGDRSQDPVLLDGDWLHVPLASRSVTIDGAVNRPGTYELLKGTFSELLELAGGFSPEANDHFGLRVSSVVGDERKMRLLDFHHDHPEAIAADLHHHDIIVVPTVDDGARVVVKGALGAAQEQQQRLDPRVADVNSASREATIALPWVDGETVRSAIMKAGGLAPWADLGNAWIQHSPLGVKVKNASLDDEGDKDRVPLDLRALFTMNDLSRDVRLQPGDTIYVPSGRVDVVVSGHVMKPGIYGYSMKLTASDYIALAGGETRDGTRSRAKVVSLDGKERKLSDSMRLQPGDSIVVPGKILTTAEWVSISLGFISIGLSSTLLGYNLSRLH